MNFKITWKSIGGLCLALTLSAALSVLLNNKAVGLGVLVMAIMYITVQKKFTRLSLCVQAIRMASLTDLPHLWSHAHG